MEELQKYFEKVSSPETKKRIVEVFAWTAERFPALKLEVKWNQPMFTDHGTFIISFSAAKAHLSVAPERACLDKFAEEIERAGYKRTRELLCIPWTSPVDTGLLAQMISFNIADKANSKTFWRRET